MTRLPLEIPEEIELIFKQVSNGFIPASKDWDFKNLIRGLIKHFSFLNSQDCTCTELNDCLHHSISKKNLTWCLLIDDRQEKIIGILIRFNLEKNAFTLNKKLDLVDDLISILSMIGRRGYVIKNKIVKFNIGHVKLFVPFINTFDLYPLDPNDQLFSIKNRFLSVLPLVVDKLNHLEKMHQVYAENNETGKFQFQVSTSESMVVNAKNIPNISSLTRKISKLFKDKLFELLASSNQEIVRKQEILHVLDTLAFKFNPSSIILFTHPNKEEKHFKITGRFMFSLIIPLKLTIPLAKSILSCFSNFTNNNEEFLSSCFKLPRITLPLVEYQMK